MAFSGRSGALSASSRPPNSSVVKWADNRITPWPWATASSRCSRPRISLRAISRSVDDHQPSAVSATPTAALSKCCSNSRSRSASSSSGKHSARFVRPISARRRANRLASRPPARITRNCVSIGSDAIARSSPRSILVASRRARLLWPCVSGVAIAASLPTARRVNLAGVLFGRGIDIERM